MGDSTSLFEWRSLRVLLVCVSLVLGGCSIHIPTIERDAIDYNQAIEQMANEVAFLNVLRAMEGMPRHYSSISAIQGDLEVTTGVDIGGTYPKGAEYARTQNILPAASDQVVRTVSGRSLAPKITGSFTTSPNFTVSVLETDEFYKGILNPIPTSTLATYLSQGWRSEVVAHLLFEAIEFQFNDGAVYRLENSFEKDAVWREWVKDLDLHVTRLPPKPDKIARVKRDLTPEELSKLYESGLTVSDCAPKKKVGGKGGAACHQISKAAESAASYRLEIGRLIKSDDIGVRLLPATKAGDDTISPSVAKGNVKPGNYKDLVLDKKRILSFASSGDSNDDGTLSYSGKAKSCTSESKTLCIKSARIVTRSADGVIYFVGEYLEHWLQLQKNDSVKLSDSCRSAEICVSDRKVPLIRISREGGFSWPLRVPALVSAEVAGEKFVIPKPSGNASSGVVEHRGMLVLSLIQQLTNLNKKASEFPQPTFIQVR